MIHSWFEHSNRGHPHSLFHSTVEAGQNAERGEQRGTWDPRQEAVPSAAAPGFALRLPGVSCRLLGNSKNSTCLEFSWRQEPGTGQSPEGPGLNQQLEFSIGHSSWGWEGHTGLWLLC